MGALLGSALIPALKAIAMKLLSQELVERLLIELLEWMAAKSDNKLDDEAVRIIKEQLGRK